ncbi:MAG: hypothetical protein KDK99_21045 [Verrucomicrobiales bacterium]|nr:hypothetical protein [Verrucomicrobiales bacterium]
MKTRTCFQCGAYLLAGLLVPDLVRAQASPDSGAAILPIPDYQRDGWNFWLRPGVGLVLSKNHEDSLTSTDSKREAKANSKLGPHVTGRLETLDEDLDFPDGDPFLLTEDSWRWTLRIQRSFDRVPGASEPAQFSWSRVDGQEDYTVDGGIMVDMYLPSSMRSLGYRAERNGFYLTVGAEMHRLKAGDAPVDNHTFFAMLNMRPAWIHAADRKQALRLGVAYTKDNITDKDSLGLLVRYEPVWWLFGREIPLMDVPKRMGFSLKKYPKPKSLLGESAPDSYQRFSANKISEIDATDPIFSAATTLSVRPFFGFNLADGSGVSSLDDVSGAFARYGILAGTSFFHRRVQLGYSLTCHTALDGGDTFVSHSAFVDLFLRSLNSRSPLTLRAAYVSGQAAPTFQDREMITIGLGIKL